MHNAHTCDIADWCPKTRDAVLQRVQVGPKEGVELDMLSWMGRTTLEVLGQAGLGYSFDPLTEDRPDEFANAVKDLLYAYHSVCRFCNCGLIPSALKPPAGKHPSDCARVASAHRQARPPSIPPTYA